MKRRILIMLLVVALSVTSVSALPFGVDLHGGDIATRSFSLWQLHRYKYTTLLRSEPLCWCPFKSYLLVDKYVVIYDRNNMNWISVKTDLYKAVRDDAEFNKIHARKYKGKTRTKIRKIYRYCRRTKYVAHVKTARDVLEHRQGDCAGIASAFYVLCKKNGIPCRYVIGWTESSCHAWNRVKVGKKWYWVDATLGYYMVKKLPYYWSVMEMW